MSEVHIKSTVSGIAYDPHIVPKLVADHTSCQQQIDLIRQAIKAEKHAETVKLLNSFKTSWLQHLYIENLKIYVYLRHSFNGSDKEREQMISFCKDMGRVRNTIVQFFDKYEALLNDASLKESLPKDFALCCSIIARRNIEEESYLFPMYQPVS